MLNARVHNNALPMAIIFDESSFIHCMHVIVVTWTRVVCLIYKYTKGPRAEGVHIRQTTSAQITTDNCHAINRHKHKLLSPCTIPLITYIYMGTLNDFNCGILLCHYMYVIHSDFID